MEAIRALLCNVVDYAGLFPPAGLAMRPAVDSYARYRAGGDAWLLGRFVAPVARLAELEGAAAAHLRAVATPWRVSALAGADPAADLDAVAEFNARHAMASEGGAAVVDALELRAATPEQIRALDRAADGAIDLYVELPLDADAALLGELVAAVAGVGARAKMRTGGVTPDAFPSAERIARFLRACADARVAFKATAGLHHPVRCVRPLTYEPGAPTGMMFGFLNVFVAAALLHAGRDDADVRGALEERDPAAFRFDEARGSWCGRALSLDQLRRARREFAIAFGSCSFEEPAGELRSLGFLA